ncbi:MAG TPA: hypothetical protein PLN33_06355 [Hyphomonadaceae bacterium]|jgi:hypothetical protein|nr:hypothetical protein [Hyphomonadaceae bacterium]HPN05157.1 hypothetical protein [Hyphomonadaceae bacterium]
MLNAFVKHVSKTTGLPFETAEAAIGIVLNAADRQGAPMADEIFERVPGARVLAANMGSQVGAATGVIARLIERTPGGRTAVAEQVIRDLQKQGLGHKEIGRLYPAIGKYAESAFGVSGIGHLGDMLGTMSPGSATPVSSVA